MLLRLPYMKLLGVSQIRTTFTNPQGPETGDTKPQQNPRARNYNQLCLWFLFWTEKNMNSGAESGPILEPTGRPQKWDLLVPDNKAAPKQGTKCGPSAGTINLLKLQPHFETQSKTCSHYGLQFGLLEKCMFLGPLFWHQPHTQRTQQTQGSLSNRNKPKRPQRSLTTSANPKRPQASPTP